MPTKIEWTEETWNPVTGCTKVSPGCQNCYAEAMCRRFWRPWDRDPPPGHFKVQLHPDRLELPLHWKKPSRIFVCSMSDLFHEHVPHSFRSEVFDVMAYGATEHHTFQVLTKRPHMIQQWESWLGEFWPGDSAWNISCEVLNRWPDNVWLGTTAENQEWANERVLDLLRAEAAVRFVSVEPMLGPVDLGLFGTVPKDITAGRYLQLYNMLSWVIIGCESGPNRRPMELQWAIDLVRQCREAQVPVFVKQIPVNGKVSKNPSEWPEELRIREYPR